MRAILNAKYLLKNLIYVEGSVSRVDGILSKCLLIFDKINGIHIFGTDTELTVKTKMLGDVEIDGSCCVSVKKFKDIVKSFGDTTLKIEKIKNTIEITSTDKCIKAKHSIFVVEKDDYPDIQEFNNSNSFIISQKILKKHLDSVKYSTSTDENRYFLKGVCIDILDEDRINFIATDGRRMALSNHNIKDKKIENKELIDKKFVVPIRAINEILRILSTDDSDCIISFHDTKVFVGINEVEIISSLIETDFLDYDSVIPKGNDFSEIQILTKTFNDSMFRVGPFMSIKDNVKCIFEVDKNIMKISTIDTESGESIDEIEVESNIKDRFCLNYFFVKESISTITDNKINIKFFSDKQPLIFSGHVENSTRHIIGPMRDSFDNK